MPTIVETTVYTFDELSPEAQEKALESHRDINVDDDFWYEHLIDHWKEKLEGYGITADEINFSGFCCQGDGASFTGYVNALDFLTKMKQEAPDNWKEYKPLLDCLSIDWSHNLCLEMTGRITRHNSHYVHERSTSVHFEERWPHRPWTGFDHWKQEEKAKKVDSLISDFEKDFEEWMVDTNREIYKELEKEYYWATADEQVKDTIEANEFQFEKDGTPWH